MNKEYETKIIKMRTGDPADKLAPAINAIKNGELVSFPTETVYGLGGNALDKKAIARIFKVKGRPVDNPLIVHIADFQDIYPLVEDIPDMAFQLADAFWPGPLTLILKRSDLVPAEVSAGLSTVAIRIPDHALTQRFIRLAGVPLAGPSANISGAPSPTKAEHVLHDLDGKIPYIIDGGPSLIGVESTVVSLLDKIPMVLRPGLISPEELMEVVGNVSIDPAIFTKPELQKQFSAPGMQYKHYAPEANLRLYEASSSQDYARFCNENHVFAFCFDEDIPFLEVPFLSYGAKNDAKDLAQNLFSALRRLDDLNIKEAVVHAPAKEGMFLSIYNRLLRSAEFEVI